jgi:hypothetical protein
MAFAIKNTEFPGSAVVTNTTDVQKATFVQEGNAPSAGVIFPTNAGSDVSLTDDLLLQAQRNLWVNPVNMTGGFANVNIPSTADTPAEAKRYQDLFHLKNVGDSATLTFPYTQNAPATALNLTVLSGATFNNVRTQTLSSGAFGNTVTLAVASALAQNSFATVQVRADNVTPGSEIITFNVVKQGTA